MYDHLFHADDKFDQNTCAREEFTVEKTGKKIIIEYMLTKYQDQIKSNPNKAGITL